MSDKTKTGERLGALDTKLETLTRFVDALARNVGAWHERARRIEQQGNATRLVLGDRIVEMLFDGTIGREDGLMILRSIGRSGTAKAVAFNLARRDGTPTPDVDNGVEHE